MDFYFFYFITIVLETKIKNDVVKIDLSETEDESENNEPNNKIRRFAHTPENELLPIKICGKLVRQYKEEIKEEIDDEKNDMVQGL